MTFIVFDEDDEQVQDNDIREFVDFKNFGRLAAPIRQPITQI